MDVQFFLFFFSNFVCFYDCVCERVRLACVDVCLTVFLIGNEDEAKLYFFGQAFST